MTNIRYGFKMWNRFLVQLWSHLKDKQITSSWLDNWVKYQWACHIVLQYNLHEVSMYVWGTMRKTVIVCILVEFCAFCDTLWIFPCWASPIKAASLSINMFPWNALNSQLTSPSSRIILVDKMIWRFLGTLKKTIRFESLLWANFNLTFMDHVRWAYKLKAPVKWDMHQFDWLIKFRFAFEDNKLQSIIFKHVFLLTKTRIIVIKYVLVRCSSYL